MCLSVDIFISDFRSSSFFNLCYIYLRLSSDLSPVIFLFRLYKQFFFKIKIYLFHSFHSLYYVESINIYFKYDKYRCKYSYIYVIFFVTVYNYVLVCVFISLNSPNRLTFVFSLPFIFPYLSTTLDFPYFRLFYTQYVTNYYMIPYMELNQPKGTLGGKVYQ